MLYLMKTNTTECMELTTNAKGEVVWAWVTWQFGNGERRCIGIREDDRTREMTRVRNER